MRVEMRHGVWFPGFLCIMVGPVPVPTRNTLKLEEPKAQPLVPA